MVSTPRPGRQDPQPRTTPACIEWATDYLCSDHWVSVLRIHGNFIRTRPSQFLPRKDRRTYLLPYLLVDPYEENGDWAVDHELAPTQVVRGTVGRGAVLSVVRVDRRFDELKVFATFLSVY